MTNATPDDVIEGRARHSIVCGDCLEVVRTIPDESIDSMVTDPPAGISFMSADWDGDKGGRDQWIAWLTERLREAYRVLKPGGYVCVWSLPRTSHWTGKAIEDAGFEVRDTIHHTFGSGFPKSLNVSLAIDRADGQLENRKVVHSYSAGGNAGTSTKDKGGTFGVGVENSDPVQLAVTRGATERSREWDGFGTAMKPGHETWWVARKPFKTTLAENVLRYGCGALNIDACRVSTDWNEPDRPDSWKASGHTADAAADKIAAPPGDGIQCHPGGRWPANVLFTHSAGCVAVSQSTDTFAVSTPDSQWTKTGLLGIGGPATATATATATAYDCAPDCPVKRLGEMSGESLSSGGTPKTVDTGPCGFSPSIGPTTGGLGDSGTAARFFNTFEWHHELDDPFISERLDSCTDIPCQGVSQESANIAELSSFQANQHDASAVTDAQDSSRRKSADKSAGSIAPVDTAGNNGLTTSGISASTAHSAAQATQRKPSAQSARRAESRSKNPETNSVQRDAAEQTTEPNQSLAVEHSTQPLSSSTQHQSSVLDVANQESIGITRTIQSQKLSSGYAIAVTSTSIYLESQEGPSCAPIDRQPYDAHWYCCKPSTSEREAGCGQLRKRSAGEMTGGRAENSAAMNCGGRTGAGTTGGGRHNHHPTLKSIALMSHLMRLVTRPGGVVLSMFLGSGTDVCAAILSGFRCIGIELNPEFAEIARARALYWSHNSAPPKKPLPKPNERQISLFGDP